MRWTRHIAQMGRREVHAGFSWENLRERDYLEDLSINGRTILKRIFKKWDWEKWTELTSLRIAQLTVSCECGNKSSGTTKFGEISCLGEDLWDSQKRPCSL
jgi:hypothetical protein